MLSLEEAFDAAANEEDKKVKSYVKISTDDKEIEKIDSITAIYNRE